MSNPTERSDELTLAKWWQAEYFNALNLLQELLESREAEAAANMTLENAQANFSDWRKEETVAFKAAMRASAAEKAARHILGNGLLTKAP